MSKRLFLSISLLALATMLATCGLFSEPEAPRGSITIEGVQVTAGEQIVVRGRSTLPDGTCLGSELWADGELQAWWPGDACVPVENGAWQMVILPGVGEVPAQLDRSAQYMIRVYQQNGPDITAVFAFDLVGPPTPNQTPTLPNQAQKQLQPSPAAQQSPMWYDHSDPIHGEGAPYDRRSAWWVGT
jgi:hypothetical protein